MKNRIINRLKEVQDLALLARIPASAATAVYTAYDRAIEIVEEEADGWIPVDERLPKEHKLYDITFKNSAGIHSDEAIYIPFCGKWFWDADESEEVEDEIMAWAEKREPYHKGE